MQWRVCITLVMDAGNGSDWRHDLTWTIKGDVNGWNKCHRLKSIFKRLFQRRFSEKKLLVTQCFNRITVTALQ